MIGETAISQVQVSCPAQTEFVICEQSIETVASIVDGLGGQGPEIAGDVEREEALREHHANQVLFGIRVPGGAQAAIPAVAAWNRGKIVTSGHHRDPKSPAMRLEEAGKRRQDTAFCSGVH